MDAHARERVREFIARRSKFWRENLRAKQCAFGVVGEGSLYILPDPGKYSLLESRLHVILHSLQLQNRTL